MALSFSFANIDLSALPGVELLIREVNSYPSRQLSTYKLARADKSITTSAEFESKTIRLNGNLKASDGNRSTAENQWATVKGYLNQREQPLVITQYGRDIQYTASASRIDDEFTGGYLEWSIEFLCADPVGYETLASTFLGVVTITTATSNQSVTVGGSHFAEPKFILQINTGSGFTSQSVTIKNAETGQGITVTRTWTAGQTLEVNSLEKLVTVDGSIVDYSGTFPKFFPGSRTVGYIDTFTTRDVSLQGEYIRRYV